MTFLLLSLIAIFVFTRTLNSRKPVARHNNGHYVTQYGRNRRYTRNDYPFHS